MHVGDEHYDEAIKVYLKGLKEIEMFRDSEAPITLEGFSLFVRVAGIPEESMAQVVPMLGMMKPMFLNQVELQMRDTLALALIEQTRYDEAELHLNAARRLSPDLLGMMDAQLLDHAGLLKERQQRYEEARDLYSEAIAAAQRTGDTARQADLQRRLEAVQQKIGVAPSAN